MESAFNPFALSGKAILVTGASSGIGRAIAIQCSRMGASVLLSGRNIKGLQATLANMDGEGHSYVSADIATPAGRATLLEATPQLDGIVHCAGIGHRKPCKAVSQEDIDLVMGINFNAAVLLQSALLGSGKVNKGASIVFMSSRTSDVPTVANSIYSASKSALKTYASCLALELAPRGIRVNSICPAMVWTDLILGDGVAVDDLMEAQKSYPLKRYGQPEDIANLAVYLLSGASSWMTGSSIDITGGSIGI